MENETKETFDSSNEEQETTNSKNSEQGESKEPEKAHGESEEEFTEREKQYYARIKKLEEENKKLKSSSSPKIEKTSQTLTNADILFLAKTDIHDEDINDVQDWARKDNISVKEAFNKYKPILDVRNQERTTAQATHTKGGARGAGKQTGEDLLRKAERTGEVPESKEGMDALAEARFKGRR